VRRVGGVVGGVVGKDGMYCAANEPRVRNSFPLFRGLDGRGGSVAR